MQVFYTFFYKFISRLLGNHSITSIDSVDLAVDDIKSITLRVLRGLIVGNRFTAIVYVTRFMMLVVGVYLCSVSLYGTEQHVAYGAEKEQSSTSIVNQNSSNPVEDQVNNTASADDKKSADARLSEMERNMQILQKRIYNDSVVSARINSKKYGRDEGSASEAEEPISEQLRVIKASIDVLKREQQSAEKRLTNSITSIEDRLKQLVDKAEQENIAKQVAEQVDERLPGVKHKGDMSYEVAAEGEESAQAVGEKISPEKAYKRAYTLLSIAMGDDNMIKDFTKARSAFENFIKAYPKSQLVGNAYYWIAETYLSSQDYVKAAAYYLRGYKANPTGVRAVSNLLQLGEVLIKLGKLEESCVTLLRLKNEFPDSMRTIEPRFGKAVKDANCW